MTTLTKIRRRLGRWRASAGKLLAGLTTRGESLWPGLRNDVLLAHFSIYRFAARGISGRRVLDPRNVRYARRHYQAANLRFEVGDCEAFDAPAAAFDRIVASNVLEHLMHPERFLDRAGRLLAAGGDLIVAVPYITTAALLAENEANPHHRSNLTVDQWLELFSEHGWQVELYRHSYPRMAEVLDFSSPFASDARVEDFEFTLTDRDGLTSQLSLTAVFVLSRAVDTQD